MPSSSKYIHLVFLARVISSSSLVKLRGSHTFLHVFKVFAIAFPSQSFEVIFVLSDIFLCLALSLVNVTLINMIHASFNP
jgi:hypothetical protein